MEGAAPACAHHYHVGLYLVRLFDDDLIGNAKKHLGPAVGIALDDLGGYAGQFFRRFLLLFFDQQRGKRVLDRLDNKYDHDLGLVRLSEIDGAVEGAKRYRRKIGWQ